MEGRKRHRPSASRLSTGCSRTNEGIGHLQSGIHFPPSTTRNVDKHRVVSAGLGEINLANTSFVPRAIDADELLKGIDVRPCEIKGTLEDGAPIAEIRFLGTHAPGTAKVDVKGQPTARVLFRAGERAASLNGFSTFCEYVADVLTAVRPLFPA